MKDGRERKRKGEEMGVRKRAGAEGRKPGNRGCEQGEREGRGQVG